MADRSLGRTVWNLVLALLNATLILVALCLFLGWKLTEAANGMAAEVADRLAEFSPVRDELRGLASDIEALRGDLAAAREGAEGRSALVFERIDDRVASLSSRVDAVAGRAETLLEAPEALIDRAVAAAGEEARKTVRELRVCTSPEPPPA